MRFDLKTLETLRKSQKLEIFSVDADAETGEWLGEPEDTGETTNAWEWAQQCRRSNETQTFDTYMYDGETQADRAIIITHIPQVNR